MSAPPQPHPLTAWICGGCLHALTRPTAPSPRPLGVPSHTRRRLGPASFLTSTGSTCAWCGAARPPPRPPLSCTHPRSRGTWWAATPRSPGDPRAAQPADHPAAVRADRGGGGCSAGRRATQPPGLRGRLPPAAAGSAAARAPGDVLPAQAAPHEPASPPAALRTRTAPGGAPALRTAQPPGRGSGIGALWGFRATNW